jgi:hypothetical protein
MKFSELQVAQSKKRMPYTKKDHISTALAAVVTVASLACAKAMDPYGSWTYCGQPKDGNGAYCVSISSTEWDTSPESMPGPEIEGTSPYTVMTGFAQNVTGDGCFMSFYPSNSTSQCNGTVIGPYLYAQQEPEAPMPDLFGFNVSAEFAACQDSQGNRPNPNSSIASCFWQAQKDADQAAISLYSTGPSYPTDPGLSTGTKAAIIGSLSAIGIIAVGACAAYNRKFNCAKRSETASAKQSLVAAEV